MTEGEHPALHTTIADGVITCTLDAPALRNSLSAPGIQAGLNAALERLAGEAALKAMVITGANGVFCSGGNLRELAVQDESALRERMERGSELYRRIATVEKPVIAAVEGAAYGAGLGLAACCDVVVAARAARFCCVFTRVGAMPDAALFWSLPARVGPARARQMMLFATELDGDAALAAGLADQVTETGAALAGAEAVARRLASGPTLAYARIKLGLLAAPMTLEDALAYQVEHAPRIFASEDFKEGARAFLEKRRPVFTGR